MQCLGNCGTEISERKKSGFCRPCYWHAKYEQKRARNIAAGLTSNGRPRRGTVGYRKSTTLGMKLPPPELVRPDDILPPAPVAAPPAQSKFGRPPPRWCSACGNIRVAHDSRTGMCRPCWLRKRADDRAAAMAVAATGERPRFVDDLARRRAEWRNKRESLTTPNSLNGIRYGKS